MILLIVKMKAVITIALVIARAVAQYRFPTVNPNLAMDASPLDDYPRLEAIHEIVKEWPSETAWDHDYDFPDEH